MSFTRGLYDKCETDTKVKESVAGLEYNLYPNSQINCKSCKNTVSKDKNTDIDRAKEVDIESELKNISSPYTNCPENKHNACNGDEKCITKFLPEDYTFVPNLLCNVVQSNIEKPTSNGIPEDRLAKMDCSI